MQIHFPANCRKGGKKKKEMHFFLHESVLAVAQAMLCLKVFRIIILILIYFLCNILQSHYRFTNNIMDHGAR